MFSLFFMKNFEAYALKVNINTDSPYHEKKIIFRLNSSTFQQQVKLGLTQHQHLQKSKIAVSKLIETNSLHLLL